MKKIKLTEQQLKTITEMIDFKLGTDNTNVPNNIGGSGSEIVTSDNIDDSGEIEEIPITTDDFALNRTPQDFIGMGKSVGRALQRR